MKYVDRDGDTWEERGDDVLVCVRTSDYAFEGVEKCRAEVESEFGPLVPVKDEPDLPTVSDVMDRAAIFQSAHALVKGLKWAEDASVYDVLSVAKWLEAGE
ncbi:hypothetical protein ABZ446_28500 [Streptomyces sp. NPDC005813]|uniref:hypothetical protein n=1 Tax=Streptomyces sp. NPDC005813 TaxID=3155592 RepID=UPI0033EAECFA